MGQLGEILKATYDRYKDADWPPWNSDSPFHHAEAARRYYEDRYGKPADLTKRGV